jgi:capsid protein
MTQFTGASAHPLLADWFAFYQSQEYTYASEWRTLASRGMALACNDPFIAAMIGQAINLTLGPVGLHLQSLFDSTPEEDGVSDTDLKTRRVITAILEMSWYGKDIDAEGSRTRREMEAILIWMSWAIGEGFAIRTWHSGRSTWRIVMPDRIRNPAMELNTATIRDGFRIDASGRIVGLWVANTNWLQSGPGAADAAPVYVPWFAADGTPNVIHRKGTCLPGMLRGVTRLAPMIILSRQLGSVLESHVAAKRLQAIHGMIVEAETPEEYQQAQATGDALDPFTFQVKGPLGIWVKKSGQTIDLPKTEFSGTDLTAYCVLMYKIQCAAVGMAVDVVLCQLSEASLSSARASLDQVDRWAQTEQEQHIAECAGVIDRVEIADAIATGTMTLSTEKWAQIMAGKYSRPPRFSTDALKDANTVKAMLEAGFSKTSAFARVSGSFEDETELRAAEKVFEAAHGVSASTGSTPNSSGPGQPPTPADPSAAPATEDQSPNSPPQSNPPAQASAPWLRRQFARLTAFVQGAA